jgi:amidase
VTRFDVVEADIAQLRSALEEGRVTSEDLVDAYRARIDATDEEGPRLNALVVMNTHARDEARASDERRVVDPYRPRNYAEAQVEGSERRYAVVGLG